MENTTYILVFHIPIVKRDRYVHSVKLCTLREGRDSSATRYGLDGPGIESCWGRDFAQTCPVAHPTSHTMGTGSFPGVKRPGRGVGHPPTSITEVKERVELHFYSPSGPSWTVLG